MIALAFVLALQQSQKSQTVSFTCRAEPLSRLLPELGKAAGLTLSVSKECVNDVMVISATGVATNSLLDEIAKVDAGAWKPEGNGYLFVADASARRAQARTEKVQRSKALRAAIAKAIVDQTKAEAEQKAVVEKAIADAKAKAKTATGGAGDAAADEALPDPDFNVSSTRVLQLLQTLDSDDLVLDPDTRVVYSTRPNQMQYALGDDAAQVLEQIVQDHNQLVAKSAEAEKDAADQAGAGDQGADGQGGAAQGATAGDPVAGLGQPPTNPSFDMDPTMKPIQSFSKADLSVEWTGTFGMFSSMESQVTLYDSKGTVLLSVNASVPQEGMDEIAAESQKAVQGGTPFELSDDSKQLMSLASAGQSPDLIGKQMKVVKDLLSDPVHKDPLSFITSDALITLAKARHKPLVALVPDEAIGDMMSRLGSKVSLETFEAELQKGDVMVASGSGNWIEVSPAHPESSREFRADRAAIAKFAKAAAAGSGRSLDDVAELAQSCPSPSANMVVMMYVSLFGSGTLTSIMRGGGSWELVRIYGSLTSEARQSLVAGGRLALQLLPTAAQTSVVNMAFGPNSQLRVGNMPDPAESPFGGFQMNVSDMQNYKSEPTEVLPGGVPSGGWLEMTASPQPCFSVGSMGGDAGIFAFNMGLDELASMKMASEMGGNQSTFGSMLEKLRVGTRTAYRLTFHLADGVRLVGTLNDDHMPKDGQVYSMSTLPDDIRAQLDKKAEDLKKMIGPDEVGQPANGGPPPPR